MSRSDADAPLVVFDFDHTLYDGDSGSHLFKWLLLRSWWRTALALLAGWITTEAGRQPWVIYGLLRTRDAVSLHSTAQMIVSLLVFIVVYCSVFGVGYYYIIRLIQKGPQPVSELTSTTSGTPARPLSAAEAVPEEETR